MNVFVTGCSLITSCTKSYVLFRKNLRCTLLQTASLSNGPVYAPLISCYQWQICCMGQIDYPARTVLLVSETGLVRDRWFQLSKCLEYSSGHFFGWHSSNLKHITGETVTLGCFLLLSCDRPQKVRGCCFSRALGRVVMVPYFSLSFLDSLPAVCKPRGLVLENAILWVIT